MARPLRFVPPNSVVEVTCRTIQARFLLRPSAQLNQVLLGILGRALDLYPKVRAHAFVFASNHVHLLLSVADAQALARFMNHFNSNVAREAGRLHAWQDRLWARRYSAIVVADEAAQVGRLRYILAHGTKEKLVSRPRDWPGLSCVRALTQGTRLAGTWRHRATSARSPQPAKAVRGSQYQVPLHPLPCWGTRGARWRRRRCAQLIREIEREYCGWSTRDLPVLGAATVLAQSPHARPKTIKRTPAPAVHAASRAVRAIFIEGRRAFADAFRIASEQLRSGNAIAEFPPFAFPPPLPFVAAPDA
jgi:REP element-mobilizing transposase RayT